MKIFLLSIILLNILSCGIEQNHIATSEEKAKMKKHGIDFAYSCKGGYCFERNGKEIKL